MSMLLPVRNGRGGPLRRLCLLAGVLVSPLEGRAAAPCVSSPPVAPSAVPPPPSPPHLHPMLLASLRAALPAAAAACRRAARTPVRAALSVFPSAHQHQHSSLEPPRVSVLLDVRDEPGALYELLGFFHQEGINLTRVESRPSKLGDRFYGIFLDFEGNHGDQAVRNALSEAQKVSSNMLVLDEKEVCWFPRHISQLDRIAPRVLAAGADLESDHPGFSDAAYRERRAELVSVADDHSIGHPIPRIDYNEDEIATWGAVYRKLQPLFDKFACREFQEILPLLETECGYSETNIPQQQDISEFLQRRTGFRLRPVGGLLSSRDFLNGLAFRVFFSTQYIRHHSRPLYTPEPDICHELLGHAPMFADPDFADFSQEIGLASLGASDEEVTKLATCYWHSVEFGLCRQDGELRAYGAGTLSSFGELEYACAPYRPAGDTDETPEYKPWDPFVACNQDYPITTYQPIYFVADSLQDAKERMLAYTEAMPKPFHARYNALSQSIWVDRAVRCTSDEEGGDQT